MSEPLICPRCESDKTDVLIRSPVPGVWEVYHCEECLFAWRSTEPDFITDPAKYDPEFKLKRTELEQASVMPTVPPLIHRHGRA
jgi:vanillate/4-hydroxybenzoate decarboxylase subunit D